MSDYGHFKNILDSWLHHHAPIAPSYGTPFHNVGQTRFDGTRGSGGYMGIFAEIDDECEFDLQVQHNA